MTAAQWPAEPLRCYRGLPDTGQGLPPQAPGRRVAAADGVATIIRILGAAGRTFSEATHQRHQTPGGVVGNSGSDLLPKQLGVAKLSRPDGGRRT